MKQLPVALLLEKNKLTGGSPWVILLELTLPNSSKVRLVNNTENITFAGFEYTAFPFKLSGESEKTSGEIPTLTLQISNVTRSIQAMLEQYDGLVNCKVVLTVINTDNLSEDYSGLSVTYDVIAPSYDAEWVTFQLGAPNPLKSRFPKYKYLSGYCSWRFKSAECGYAGSASDCNGTFADCSSKNNTARFGGFVGLKPTTLRVV